MPKKEKKSEKPKKGKSSPFKVTGISALIELVNKEYGDGTLLKANEATSLVRDWIPTGIFDLDIRTGGGFPRGCISMVKGEYSSWKTSLALKGLSNAQRMCRFCGKQFEIVDHYGEVYQQGCSCGACDPMIGLWVDAEHTWDPTWSSKWGVNCDEVVILQPESAEQAVDVVDRAIRTQACDFVVVDSIAALTPIIESEESASEQQMGIAARIFNKACRKWTAGMNSYGLLAKTKCTVVLINQMRQKIGPFAGVTSPGGKGFDFFQSLELRMKQEEHIVDEASGRNIGATVSYKITKNKAHPPSIPFGEFSLFFSKVRRLCEVGSTDLEAQVARFGEYWGLIQKGGAWYNLNGQKYQGKNALYDALRKNPGVLLDLMTTIRKRENIWVDEGVSVVGEGDVEQWEDVSEE